MNTLAVLLFCCGILTVTNSQCPTVVTRAEWGARPANTAGLPNRPAPYYVIHHTEGSFCSNKTRCSELMRWLQNFHMDNHGWADIGYNFVIGGDGLVYEGRGWGKHGAHAPGYNDRSVGISFMGTYIDSAPSSDMLEVCQQFMACGVALGHVSSSYDLIGHRQATPTTDCPGNALYHVIQDWPNYKPCPNIVTRDEWGAHPAKSNIEFTKKIFNKYIIHQTHENHCPSSSCLDKQNCSALMRQHQNYHMNSRGCPDIAYNFVIGGDGLVYEGRGWGKESSLIYKQYEPEFNLEFYHARSDESVRIALMGSFKYHSAPPIHLLDVCQQLMACGVSLGFISNDYEVSAADYIMSKMIENWPQFKNYF